MSQEINNSNANDPRYDLFLKLFMKNQGELFGFIMKLLPNYSVAEDIMQETMTTAWQKFVSFEEGTNYIAWVKRIARYKVMGYIGKSKSHSIVHFSDDVLEELANQEPAIVSQNIYFEALHGCVGKLKGHSREIVRLRYAKNMKVKEIAVHLDTTCNALSQHMSRVHYSLKKCIERTMRAWDITNG